MVRLSTIELTKISDDQRLMSKARVALIITGSNHPVRDAGLQTCFPKKSGNTQISIHNGVGESAGHRGSAAAERGLPQVSLELCPSFQASNRP